MSGKERITIRSFLFSNQNKDMMFVAAIYDNNQFCLITEEADIKVKKIHHRQPVILKKEDIKNYLNLEIEGQQFLYARKKPNLEFYEISKDVNKPTNNNLSLIQKIN